MIFSETEFEGLYIITPQLIIDNRGFFARIACQQEFDVHNLRGHFVQTNVSNNLKPYTFRGLHYQSEPYQEDKLVRCIHGAIQDIVLDLRPESKTFMKSTSFILHNNTHVSLYVPKGFAHGYLTLVENTSVLYQVTEFYVKSYEHGIRYNDPAFNIELNHDPEIISERDLNHPDFRL